MNKPIRTPGVFVPQEGGRRRRHTGRRQAGRRPVGRRRGVDLSSLASLLLGLPWLIVSLAVDESIGEAVAAAVPALRFETGLVAWIVLGIFLCSGAVIFIKPTEAVLARLLFRVRRPVGPETACLEPAWNAVAGPQATRYSLWVQESRELNAFASAGHIVAVTRAAVETLQPNQLAAILAHEYGHHLRGHGWATLLAYWYSIPARVAFRISAWCWRVAIVIANWVWYVTSHFGIGGFLFGGILLLLVIATPVTIVGGILVGAALEDPRWLLVLLIFCVPAVLAALSRHGEKRADRVAAELGFGPALIEVFYAWIREGHDLQRSQAGARARLLSTHPSLAARIRALEKYLDRKRS